MEEHQINQAFRASELIFKYLREELSPAEEIELDTWVNQTDSNRSLFSELTNPDRMNADLNEFFEIERGKKKAHAKLMKKVFGHEDKHSPVMSMWRYMAAAVVILLIAGGIYWVADKGSKQQEVVRKNNVPPDVSPGGSKAMLKVDGGYLLDLTRDADSSFSEEGIRITNHDGRLVYDGVDDGQRISYHTIIVPNGGEYQLMLEDGTKVWLNAASTLRYPTKFTGKYRQVQLTGEAYFEVVSDKRHPFIVDVDSMLVTVTGTEFNINAYHDETLVKSTLFEGKVKISKDTIAVDLMPGQQLQFDRKTSDVSIISDADLEAAVAWKEGLFKLTSADIPTIMRQIARWYDIEIVYQNAAIPQGHISGTIPRNLNLTDILKVLEDSGVKFRFDGKKLTVLK